MNRLGLMVAAALLGVTMVTASSFVPPVADQASAQTTRQDRATAMRQKRLDRAAAARAKRSAERAKRTECRREAKDRKLGVVRSMRYVRACMKRA